MAKRKIAFLDRDGTLIIEPDDFQIDSLEKLELVPGVIPALLKLQAHGYELVIVSNQDGLGTDAYPTQDFEIPQQKMLSLFSSQGIEFAAIHVDPHFPEANAFTRKPEIGMVLDYLKSGDLDLERSVVVGDRETDLQLAENMGIRGFRVGSDGEPWNEVASQIIGIERTARVARTTKETAINVTVNLDRSGPVQAQTGIGFFDHMLEQIGHHAQIALNIECSGDLHIDDHHTVEDVALSLGQALRQAIGDKIGIGRYGFALPMDETRAEALIDLSGRPVLRFQANFAQSQVGALNVQMIEHFFKSLSDALAAAIHITADGENDHHIAEGCFKAFARAFGMAVRRVGLEDDQLALPSSKGLL